MAGNDGGAARLRRGPGTGDCACKRRRKGHVSCHPDVVGMRVHMTAGLVLSLGAAALNLLALT
jgi:hypothetical protein